MSLCAIYVCVLSIMEFVLEFVFGFSDFQSNIII